MANNRLYIEDTDPTPGDEPKRILVATTLGDGWVWRAEADKLTHWLDLRDIDSSYGNTGSKPSQLKFVTENEQPACDEASKLYRYLWITRQGYVVFRDLASPECDATEAALAHRVAVFVAESDAADYCRYRNDLTARSGTDAIDPLRPE